MRASEFRVFLSSTFRDLQPEREQLVKKVFPRIRAVCCERGVEFTEIDLRWGITAEESRSGKAVRICLDEIGRCAPYFIGILGSRYGWVPGIDELKKDEECVERYSWLIELGEQYKSITEMEITHGALRREDTDSAFFYEQTSYLDQIPEYELDKFDSLKTRIQNRGFGYSTFETPESLGEQVYRDLLLLLDRDFPADTEPTPLELERAPHLAFSINRLRSYVADPEYLKRFEAQVESDDIPLIIWGRSGLGKSSLMAYLADTYAEKHPDSFVIMHFIGAAATGSDPEDVMRQIMMEICERYHLDEEIPQDEQKIREEFPLWLAKVQNEKLVLVIDALNVLTGVAEELHWLPEFIPSNVRLIVSTTPGHTLEQLRRHKWQELELQPLEVSTRRRIANEYLSLYNKKLSPEQLEVIACDQKCESPLFLRTLLEEIRVFGRHTALDEHIAHYLNSKDERELFSNILERMEDDFGAETVGSVLRMIFTSRYGLSQTELLGVTEISQLALSEFLMALEYHLMQRTGLYTFFHNYLRDAVEHRYIGAEQAKRSGHYELAKYFGSNEFNLRRRDEEPWQWEQAADMDALRLCLMRPAMVALFDDEHQTYEAFAYWKKLGKISFDEQYIDRLSSKECDLHNGFIAYKNIINLFSTAGEYGRGALFLDAGFRYFCERVEARTFVDTYVLRAELELHQANYEIAIEQARSLMSEENTELRQSQSLQHRMFEVISVSYYQLGNYDEAERIVREQIKWLDAVYGPQNYEAASEYTNLGAILMSAGKLTESETVCRKAHALFAACLGISHPETATCQMNLAACLYFQKRYEDALPEFKAANNVFLASLGPNHAKTLGCEYNIAVLFAYGGQTGESRTLARELLNRSIILNGEETLQTARVGLLVGYTYYLEKVYADARPYYERYLPIRVKIQGDSHPDVITSLSRFDEIRKQLAATDQN